MEIAGQLMSNCVAAPWACDEDLLDKVDRLWWIESTGLYEDIKRVSEGYTSALHARKK